MISLAAFVLKDPDGSDRVHNLSPSVYTRVGSFIPFIRDNLRESNYSGPSPTSGQTLEPVVEPQLSLEELNSGEPELSLEELNDLFVRPATA